MRIKTEIGTTILIAAALILVVSVVIGGKKLSKDLSVIESSINKVEKSLDEK